MPIQLVENSVVAGRFRLNKMIGRGGMGSVWQATHLGLDIPCAVKFMEGEFSKSTEAQQRFEREAKAAAQLRSPHVVQVLDHGVCEETPYIAMELLDGEDLGKRIQKLGKIHPRDLNVIITQVCRALTKAHSLGIVHRDLKPDNIFLVRDDDREIAKVLDFGIAKSAMSALEGSNTKTGAMLGTPYYMSPEQAQGVKSVDYRSDLWSLAVIVYQCVTGRLPFESEALGDLLMKIIVQPLPVPSQVAEVSAGFDGWWARAASRDPAARFQSAKEFAESLMMVFGASQATDVMDIASLKAMLGNTPNPGGPRSPLMLTPSGAQPAPAGFSVTTGAPIARTFADEAPPVLPQKRSGMVAVISFAAVFAVVVSVGGYMAMHKGASGGTAAASAVAPPPAAVDVPAAPAVAAAPVAVAPAAPAAAAPVIDTTPTPAAAAPVPAPAAAPAAAPPAEEEPHHHHSDHSAKPAQAAAAAPVAKPAAKPAAATSKGSDLGF
jgi:serine/threonine protein kinase